MTHGLWTVDSHVRTQFKKITFANLAHTLGSTETESRNWFKYISMQEKDH